MVLGVEGERGLRVLEGFVGPARLAERVRGGVLDAPLSREAARAFERYCDRGVRINSKSSSVESWLAASPP